MAAVPFITIEDDGAFAVDPRGAELLESLTGPIAVVAVAGLYRTGKSYLLNRLVDSGDGGGGGGGGFAVGSTVNACTKGLWLWGAPRQLPDGTHVVFVDTEGLGSTSRSATEDSRVFALALLLSSLFVYNSRGVIDNAALDEMSLVVELTKHIQVSSSAASSEQDVAAICPAFVWVLRDFSLRLEDDGRQINSRQYLENALRPQEGFSEDRAAKNQVRRMLSTFFAQRDCVTLVRPVNDEEQLRRLEELPPEQLRPEFLEGLQTLRQRVEAGARPKLVGGRPVTGGMLATLAQAYVQAINGGGVPTVSTAWERVVAAQCSDAVAAGEAAYAAAERDGVVAQLPLAAGDLRRLHAACAAAAEAAFAERALEGDALPAARDALRRALDDRLRDLEARNEAASRQACEGLVEELQGDVEGLLSSGSGSLEAALQNWATQLPGLTAGFRERARGPYAWEALARFLEGPAAAAVAGHVGAADAREREQQTALRKALAEAQRAAEEAGSRAEAAGELHAVELASARRAAEDGVRAATLEARAAQARLDDRDNELASARHAVELLEASHARELAHLRERVERAEAEASEARVALVTATDEADRGRRAAERELLESERGAREGAAELARAQAELGRRKGGKGAAVDAAREAQREAEASAAAARVDAADVRGELKVAEERARGLQAELDLLREHAALLTEHLGVAKERQGVAGQRVEELEYQWGSSKARLAQLESDVLAMRDDAGVLERLVALLKPRVLRLGRMPADVVRALEADAAMGARLEGL